MEKYDIINFLIKNREYKTYLEIGMDNPNNNYLKINCVSKESCDPYFPPQNDWDGGYDNENLPDIIKENLTYHMTSDEMFDAISPDKKWDIIFVDGYHTEDQVSKDIYNSMKHITRNGCIVVHDSIPGNESMQEEVRTQAPWNGTVWKAVAKLNGRNINFKTIDIPDGLTIIEFSEHPNFDGYLEKSEFIYSDDFGKKLMHIISVEAFKQIYAKLPVSHFNLPINLVAHFYVPSYYEGFPWLYDIHFNCLKEYSNIFTNVVFVLAVDNNYDESIVNEYKKHIFDIGFRGDIAIKIRKNSAYREAKTFKEEIVDNLEKLEGITFFIHGKGISNVNRNDLDINQVLDWVASSYFQMFDNFDDVILKLINGNSGICYGPFLFNHEYCFTKNNWYYSGSFQCINTKKLCNYINANKISVPELCDRAYAETFLGDIIKFSTFVCRSVEERYVTSTPLVMYENSVEASKFFLNEKFNEYEKFKLKVLMGYGN